MGKQGVRGLLALTAFVLTACGGGGGGASSAPAPVQAVIVQPVSVAMFGDSTQLGYTSIQGTPITPPAAVAQALLRQWTGNQGITVVSHGVSMTASGALLDGTDGSGLAWPARVSASGAQIVVVNHGINDSWLPVTTDDTYRANITAIVRGAQAAGVRIMLETPGPVIAGGSASSAGYDIADHEAKVRVMREVAAATGAALCDVNARILEQNLDTLEMIRDGVHPSPELYTRIGGWVAQCLLPMVR